MEKQHIKAINKRVIKILTLAIILTSMVTAYAIETQQQTTFVFSGGDGSANSPFLISNLEELKTFTSIYDTPNNLKDAYFKLTSDIDLGDTAWKPIGSQDNGFTGILDGNGKKITVRNFEDGNNLGFFHMVNNRATIKNLIVKGIINKNITSEKFKFGLIAANAEGTIENCITEGSVLLTVNATEDILVGGIIGFGRGNFSYLKNDASLNITATSKNNIAIGGIVGQSTGSTHPLSNATNTGTIDAKLEGISRVGGISGEYGFDSSIYNALNEGNISITTINKAAIVGGITGEIRESIIDRALNKAKIYVKFSGQKTNDEIKVGGITGVAEFTKLLNVGNEGNVEARDSFILYASGIGSLGNSTSLANAYTKGNVYGTSPYERSELYVEGLTGDVTVADNFYNSGSVRLKALGFKEVNGDAITNIRPGESPKTFNYGYWPNGALPFPILQKAEPTTSSFSTDTGKLSRNINIGTKSYSTIAEALNGWVYMQSNNYLRWTGDAKPIFDFVFGYVVPEQMLYRNGREGKWLNASDWAYDWMDKADKLNIIPQTLLQKDVTKGITRREFSALAIYLYEHLSNNKATLTITTPFKDIDDEYVTKAYELGIVTGTGNGLFSPNDVLTREQASTMLARVYQKVYNKALDNVGAVKFQDDKSISSWAKDSVYFMAKNNILNGVGNNIFEANGGATKEQAFKIAVAMIEKFK